MLLNDYSHLKYITVDCNHDNNGHYIHNTSGKIRLSNSIIDGNYFNLYNYGVGQCLLSSKYRK